mmetsp:Transcript_17335/g.46254  ORF Transcript_17335/g.46254 Transcript_17335/m.46254 type:complete len:232 (-) Transcript_17335:291-986(-)
MVGGGGPAVGAGGVVVGGGGAVGGVVVGGGGAAVVGGSVDGSGGRVGQALPAARQHRTCFSTAQLSGSPAKQSTIVVVVAVSGGGGCVGGGSQTGGGGGRGGGGGGEVGAGVGQPLSACEQHQVSLASLHSSSSSFSQSYSGVVARPDAAAILVTMVGVVVVVVDVVDVPPTKYHRSGKVRMNSTNGTSHRRQQQQLEPPCGSTACLNSPAPMPTNLYEVSSVQSPAPAPT